MNSILLGGPQDGRKFEADISAKANPFLKAYGGIYTRMGAMSRGLRVWKWHSNSQFLDKCEAANAALKVKAKQVSDAMADDWKGGAA